jgi:SAM-dependent methyltransferase
MKNKENWKPTKYIWKKTILQASRDKNQVYIGSRLIADIIAEYYGKYLPTYARGKLLDLGCGYVPLFAVYSPYVSDTICVDWENTLHKNEHLDFTCDLNKNLPFGDNEFDTIILSDVLEHIQNPALLWKEIARILSPKGVLIMNVPFMYWVHERPYDYYRYTEFALKRFIEQENLELILLESVGGVLEVLGDICAKMLASRRFMGGGYYSTDRENVEENKNWEKTIRRNKRRISIGLFSDSQKGCWR